MSTVVTKIDVHEQLARITAYWQPKIVGALNGQHVKLVKFCGQFPWHHHEAEDELFFVLRGSFTMEFPDRHVVLSEGELLIVPRGIEHRPVAENEVEVMLFEPEGTRNTGNHVNEFTHNPLKI